MGLGVDLGGCLSSLSVNRVMVAKVYGLYGGNVPFVIKLHTRNFRRMRPLSPPDAAQGIVF